jgi:hypothetical protein
MGNCYDSRIIAGPFQSYPRTITNIVALLLSLHHQMKYKENRSAPDSLLELHIIDLESEARAPTWVELNDIIVPAGCPLGVKQGIIGRFGIILQYVVMRGRNKAVRIYHSLLYLWLL